MTPRPYQQEAMDATHDFLCTRDQNPCVVLPTGSGKTPTMAWMIQRYLNEYPTFRVLILAHVRELLTQGVEKMKEIWPLAPVGIFSAGLKAKDRHEPITYASIQSIWRHAARFEPWDLIFVDEAHRIPLEGETTYRHFLGQAKECNPNLRIVGWTATNFRLDGGPICGPGHILNEVAYEANVRDLIEAGYLCPLRTKGVENTANMTGAAVRKGEFVTADVMSRLVGVVAPAVREAVARMEGRRSCLFFCVTVAHALDVSEELLKAGIHAPVVHAKTPLKERTEIIRDFTDGTLRAVVNVNVLAEGFDARRIDCVVLMRPTASAGLFYQQVGRGLRLWPEKQDALILDFAGNTLRHGPIDRIKVGQKFKGDGSGESPAKECPGCQELIHAALRECPACGYEFPPREIVHDTLPAEAPIISEARPWECDVLDVEVRPHQKQGKPPSIMVIYYGALEHHREWVCLEHEGFARTRARQWWKRRFGDPIPETTADALNQLFLAQRIRDMTRTVTVKRVGKYTEITYVRLKDDATATAIAH